MITRALTIVLFALTLASAAPGAEPTPAPDVSSPEQAAEILVGFWMIDLDAMRQDPQFKATLESPQGLAGILYAQGAMIEFSADKHLRTHMGAMDDRAATVTLESDGAIRVDPEGSAPWIVRPISDEALIQRFPDVPFQILWTRSWDPFVGTWRVSMEDLDQQHWYSSMTAAQRDALGPEAEALTITVDDAGAVTGQWSGKPQSASLRLEATTPPAAGLVEAGASQASAHIVRSSDTGMSLYVGERTWPLRRVHPPSSVVPGNWKFDLDRARSMQWIKNAVPEGKSLDEFLAENVKLENIVSVTDTEWNSQPYEIVDERADQFAARANGSVVFWVRVIDENHISQHIAGGREFPLVRVGPGAKAPAASAP